MQGRASTSVASTAEPTPISRRVPRQSPENRSPHPRPVDTPPTRPEPASPLLLVLAMVGAGYALLFLAAIVTQKPVKLIDTKYLGLDFTDFWAAAGDVLPGGTRI